VIDAIDRIQGQESDIVFISFCRAKRWYQTLSPSFGLWLRDIRRLNVAFTRARRALVLVGHRPTLEKLGKYQPFYSHLFNLFDRHPADLQMIQDFGVRRRPR
jgi:superfamily I DNA and/or RNA helicase